MCGIQAAQDALIDEFALFDDWMSRYEYLIELGGQLEAFPAQWKTEENLIKGCQSQVWLNIKMQDDVMRISGVSDAAIVSGLIALIIRVYDGQKPVNIAQSKPEFITQIGFNDHLSPTRSNGLYAMLSTVFEKAHLFKS